jgi:peptide subunit release factor 1 (eRF1)
MISLIIPPKDQISRVSKMLADEFGTASNIKSRVNRLSVLGAITSVQHRLKLYTKGEFSTEIPCNMFHGFASSASKWSGDLLWNHRDGRGKGEES